MRHPTAPPALHAVRPSPSPALTIAVRRWPVAMALHRPSLRLDEVLWRSTRRLPGWLERYLLVDWPVPTVAPSVRPSPFRAESATIPSCLAVQGVLAAIHNAGPAMWAWAHLDTGQPAFSWRKPAGAVTVSVRLPLWGDGPPDQAHVAAWEVVRRLNDLDGDVLLIALAHSLAHAEPDGTTWITADTILDERGIRPKTERAGAARYQAGHRREDRVRVAAAMERLARLWVALSAVAVMERRGGRPRRDRRDDEGALLIIAERLMQGEGAIVLVVKGQRVRTRGCGGAGRRSG